MEFYFLGLGLNDETDISVKGVEIVKKCDKVYLENYTGFLSVPVEKLEKLYCKKIILANREMVEQNPEKTILKDAKNTSIAFLVVGDPLSATTHVDLKLRAEKLGIKCFIVHNASVFSAVGETGLQLYKFGRVSSIPFSQKGFIPETPYDTLKENCVQGLHTLLLLDLKPEQGKFMTIPEAIEYLLGIEEKRKEEVFTKQSLCIGCARLGSFDCKIKTGTAEQLLEEDFGKPMHCLIIPGKLHFIEEEAVNKFR